ncbi:TonB C-terminal domain-containing protein [Bradyrhizobium mercantei]|uniref:TonB C-terminal domain-containing protein n=1 Tax=Bradyrhizobium mercantei TaxID=1904807 RepID=UPI0009759E55|nr:TonB C-terminal domain-containing protein [Bradyrhizobium mercantei]
MLGAGTDFAMGQESPIASAPRISFDIPSQPLTSALESYGATSKREVLYDARLATGRVSGEVRGVFAPSEALQLLLDGTGLVGRLVSENAVVIVSASPAAGQRTTADVDTRKGDPVLRARYYAVVQERVREAFCRDSALRPGRYRIAVQFWIAPTGTVDQTRLLGKSGDARIDSAIETTLRGLKMKEVPPPGISQPLTMVVAPRPSEQAQDCAGIDAIRTSGGAN